MDKILFFIYDIGIFLGDIYIYTGRYFSGKLNLLYLGRKKSSSDLERFSLQNKESIWIHCASLGEFEQGRPLIEMIKEKIPNKKIILSFFSPSGYEIRKDYSVADLVVYLPSDKSVNVHRIIQQAKPSVFIFVKYEFWWRLIASLLQNKTKVFLISGVFRSTDYFFTPLFIPFKKLLMKFEVIYVQDKESSIVLNKNGFNNHNCAGDTRIDRVIQNKSNLKIQERWQSHIKDKKVMVYGSVWISDMKMVKNIIETYPDFIHIIAPHDISLSNISQIANFIKAPADLYSSLVWQANIIIIDNIGILMSLYSLAKYAYIGGGFGQGIHNILEPAVFNIPVFFGPKHQKFNEASTLKSSGTVFAIRSPAEMIQKIEEMEKNPLIYQAVAQNLVGYFDENKGATEKIYKNIEPILKNPL